MWLLFAPPFLCLSIHRSLMPSSFQKPVEPEQVVRETKGGRTEKRGSKNMEAGSEEERTKQPQQEAYKEAK